MGANLPGVVDKLVNIGLSTGEEADRVVALASANQADSEYFYPPKFGLKVAEIFLDQLGLSLEAPTSRVNEQSWGDYATAGDARVMREVDTALGSHIGVKSRFYEFLGRSTNQTGSIVAVDGLNLTNINRSFSPVTPFLVMQHYSTDRSRDNFQAAVRAVKGITSSGVNLDESWCDGTLDRIRDLDEF